MVRRNQDYKYITPFQDPYEIVQTWMNRTVTIRRDVVTARLHVRRIKPYDIPEIQLNKSTDIVDINISATYNVTSICPYI